MENSKHDIEFIGGIPDSQWLENEVQSGSNATIIIDDMASQLGKDLVEMFTVFSHHLECNLIFVAHNLFDRHSGFRDISLNSKYLIIFKNPIKY